MPVKKGDKVKVDYTGKLEDGTVFDSSTHGDHSHPLEFEVGAGKVIKGFEDAVIGMKKGDEKKFKLQPDEAYGKPNPQLVQTVKKDQLPKGPELKKGMTVFMQTPQGQQIPATITDVSEDSVTFDLNHPLAGKILNFEIKLMDVS